MIAFAARAAQIGRRAVWPALGAALPLWLAIGPGMGNAFAQAAEQPYGVWRHPENGSRIRIYSCGHDQLCARILSVGDAQRSDDKNPDPGLRERQIVGLVIVEGAGRTGEATWSGRLYNRTDGRHYDGHLKVVGPDRLELTGCAIVILCRSAVWHRER
jgi:uncharacterized protein (DUF2147 family)